MFGRADAEQGQAACQHRPGGFGESQPGTVGGRGFLVTGGQGRAGVVEVEERVRDGFQLPGDPVGRAVTGPGEQDAGVVGDEVEEGAGRTVVRGCVPCGEAEEGGPAGEGTGPGVGVTDPEERVRLALDEQFGAEGGAVVPGGPQEPPAGRVGPEPLQQLPRGDPGGDGSDSGERYGGRPVRVDGDAEAGPVRIGRLLAADPDPGALGGDEAGARHGR